MFHKTSPQRYSNIFSAFQFLFPPLTPDLPLPSSPQSDVKLICQMSSRWYILAHRFPTISNQFAALLESLLSTKKTLLFFPSMIHVPSALTVDSCLLKKFLNYKLSSLSDLYLRYHTISETMVFCWESPSTRRERWNNRQAWDNCDEIHLKRIRREFVWVYELL